MKARASTICSIFLIAGIIAGFSAYTPKSQAAAPRMFITWEARTFYPSDFPGKSLPVTNSAVTASAFVAQDGTLMNPDGITFTWYVDGEWIGQELGKREAIFSVSKLKGDAHAIRVLATLSTGERVETSVRIPITSPAIVVQANREGDGTSVRALPFFFNVHSLAELVFSWIVNNSRQEAQTNTVTLQPPTALSVSAVNTKNQLEFARQTLQLP